MGIAKVEYKVVFNNSPVLKDRVVEFIKDNSSTIQLFKTRELAIMLGVSQQYLKRLMNEYS